MVTATRTRTLLLTALLVAAAGWLALRWWTSGGHEPPQVPWTAPGVVVLLLVAVTAFGWPVRRWTRGHRDVPLDPLRAARTVVLAKAVQHCGCLLTGWYAAQALALASTADVEARRDLLVRVLAGLAATAALWVGGWLVERWCRVDRAERDG